MSAQRLRGQSHISWKVERDARPPVVLRMTPQRGILPPYDLIREAALMDRLREAGLHLPAVLGRTDELAPTARTAGACLVLEWIDGSPLSNAPMDAQSAAVYCQTLQQIHSLDSATLALPDLEPPPRIGAALREREEIRRRLESFNLLDVAHIQRLREALAGRPPSIVEPMLVHGDVNFGNIILQPDGRPVVLDWEQAHLGDPLSDWGRLAAEDLLGNLELTPDARTTIASAVADYGRSAEDLHYWTLHQLFKHASATGALTVLRGWDMEQIAAMYDEPTRVLLSAEPPAIWT